LNSSSPNSEFSNALNRNSDTELATYLLRVKEEDAANDFVAKVKEYAVASK
jgi:hypothetical protein